MLLLLLQFTHTHVRHFRKTANGLWDLDVYALGAFSIYTTSTQARILIILFGGKRKNLNVC